MDFYLGTHHPHWLGRMGVPLFVSDRWLRDRKTFPRAVAPWALDSGGFTELSQHGSWEHGPTPVQYVKQIRRYVDEIGRLDWAAPQDWMCEAWILAKTGLTVADHHRLTVDNYRELRDLAPDLPIVPVVQGGEVDDYRRCVELYARRGVDLTAESRVGVGSVCRRQGRTVTEEIFTALHLMGVTNLHGFGLKIQGIRAAGRLLTSADSLAWSYEARRAAPLPDCSHKSCANCPQYARRWRDTKIGPLLSRHGSAWLQPSLDDAA